jgi:hypothetical protein
MENLTDIIESAPEFFASTYAKARELFRDACTAHGASAVGYPHPLKGPEGEALAIDVALVGPPDASNLLVVISGTHGLEGPAGSGCQVAWLRLHTCADLPPDTAVLLVHMLNPWGCAWARRQTEDNVDLNRNFCDFDEILPANPLYEAVRDIVVSPLHLVRAAADPSLGDFRKANGDQALAAALFSGQYQHSDGVGFGGNKATWSSTTLRGIVGTYAMSAKRAVALDIHTGLGPFGYGTLLSAESPQSSAMRRARSYFGPGVAAVSEEASVPYEIHGNLLNWISSELPCEVTCVAIEFGTEKLEGLLELQVDDCRLQNFNDSWAALSQVIRRDLVEFFFPATTDWMQSVMLRTLQMMHLALRGMQYEVDRGTFPRRW